MKHYRIEQLLSYRTKNGKKVWSLHQFFTNRKDARAELKRLRFSHGSYAFRLVKIQSTVIE